MSKNTKDLEQLQEAYSGQIDPALFEAAKKQQAEKDNELAKEAAEVVDFSADSDFSLSSWGYTEPLKVTHGDQVKYVKLKIKAVGVQDVIERTEKRAPRPPSTMKTYKKGSPEAIALGSQQAVIVREVDYSDPEYMNALDEHNRVSGQVILLSGLMYDWKDSDGKLILRGADPIEPNDIINEAACFRKLKLLRLTASHYGIILKNIRELTVDEEVRESQE